MHNIPTSRDIQFTRWDNAFSMVIGVAAVILVIWSFVDYVSNMPVA